MNKTLEYMAFGLPVVAFDLKETRVSAENAACYVADGDVEGYARAIVDLLDDEPRRAAMGAIGRARIEGAFGWPYQRGAYVGVYDQLVGRVEERPRRVVVLPESVPMSQADVAASHGGGVPLRPEA
jgi:glycosyltransferase involved in cell wall biosynthesis